MPNIGILNNLRNNLLRNIKVRIEKNYYLLILEIILKKRFELLFVSK